MGFEMREAGFKKISLNPKLFGLEYAEIKMPTPYGYITVSMKSGAEPIVDVPKEIEVVL